MHGGQISVKSEGINRGSTFLLRFAATTAVETEFEEVVTNGREPRRILVVEDNDDAREMMEAALSLDGHTVRVAAHGAKALEEVRSGAVDIVLLDVGLPDIDGYEVARRMRALEGGDQLRIVALTGYGQAEDQRRAFEAGFDLHLTKPVGFERLREVLVSLDGRK
jgi:CheY-like chemotaxis protein